MYNLCEIELWLSHEKLICYLKYLPVIFSKIVSQQTVLDWYWSKGIFLAIPNITLKVFVLFWVFYIPVDMMPKAGSSECWEVVIGRVEQEDARTVKEAD